MSDVKVKHEFTYTQRRDRINVHLAELRASTSEEFILSYVLQQLHRSTLRTETPSHASPLNPNGELSNDHAWKPIRESKQICCKALH